MTLKLYDNTRLSDYKRCPRLFYYRHVRGWVRDGRKLPLIFGGCWHRAMDSIWRDITDGLEKTQIIARAHKAFMEEWVDEGLPAELSYEEQQELSPRTPMIALEMIVAYVTERMEIIGRDFELVHIERPFAVPLDQDDDSIFYIGKIDKIVRRAEKIYGIEHKTTTAYRKGGPFRSTFLDSFSPNSQVDGYLYALHMMYPNEVGGVWVDAGLVHKSEEGFKFIPVEKQLAQLDLWMWEALTWIDKVEENKQRLEEVKPDAKYMAAFPKNTNSCFDFNTACPFIDLCKAWPNPHGKDTPPGFRHEVWNPLDHIDVNQLPFSPEDSDE